MNIKSKNILAAILWPALLFSPCLTSAQNETAAQTEITNLVQTQIQEKSKFTGTLDLYDAQENKVRNLKWLKFNDAYIQEGNVYTLGGDYRDQSTGDTVQVDALVENQEGQWTFKNFTVQKVTPFKPESAEGNETPKEISPQDVLTFVKDYIQKQSAFSGSFSVYDQEKNILRNLKTIEFSDEVKTFGILNIAHLTCQDVQSHETVALDVTVENKEGRLSVQSMRVKEGKKP